MASGAARRTERLMCLVFIVKSQGRRGITRAQLRASVQDYAGCPNEAAFERMFERDKRDLREAGVLLDVVQRDAWHEDEHAYVLSPHSMLSLPPLSAEEFKILGLAADAWDRGSWEALATGAIRKVEVFAQDLEVESSPRVSIQPDMYVDDLRRAVLERTQVTFTYRRPGDSVASQRTIEPWGLIYRSGGWYCVGFDIGRDAPRVFRTSRIASEIVMGAQFVHTVDANWRDVFASSPIPSTIKATLLVLPGHGMSWRALGRAIGSRDIDGTQYDIIEAELNERDGLVGALAAAAPHVLVAHPVDLQSRIVDVLEVTARG